MKILLLAAVFGLVSCTPTTGKIAADVLVGACDVGAILLAAPGLEPICADIPVIEQLLNNWKQSRAMGLTMRPMSQTDLYMMVKTSGRYKPAKGAK
jgi:hypothetical protein